MTKELPTLYRDLPAEAFPFTIRFIDDDTDELLDTITVEAPSAVRVPGYAPRRVRVETKFANSDEVISMRPGE